MVSSIYLSLRDSGFKQSPPERSEGRDDQCSGIPDNIWINQYFTRIHARCMRQHAGLLKLGD